jgi:DNA-binding beta-propeller fold protein YncE
MVNGETRQMSEAGRIVRVNPARGIPGGEVIIECADFDARPIRACGARFDGSRGHMVGASSRRALAIIPEIEGGGEVDVTLECDERRTVPAKFTVASRLAEDLHLVANPAFDPDDGSLYVTRSGSRGQQFPVTIFRIDTNGALSDFSGDIVNPTGIAFDKSGQMFVSSRMDGTVYRVTPFKEAVAFASDLGVATGLAFDREGRMYVGDRTGTIYRVNGIGEENRWAQLEQSVSAYHLAFGPDDALYVTGPTVSSFESVMRINQSGEVSVFYRGLGRPHGLAFDREGFLYVAASLHGRRGIIRITPDGSDAEMFVAGMNVVGVAFSPAGEMVVATHETVYSVPLGIYGTLL